MKPSRIDPFLGKPRDITAERLGRQTTGVGEGIRPQTPTTDLSKPIPPRRRSPSLAGSAVRTGSKVGLPTPRAAGRAFSPGPIGNGVAERTTTASGQVRAALSWRDANESFLTKTRGDWSWSRRRGRPGVAPGSRRSRNRPSCETRWIESWSHLAPRTRDDIETVFARIGPARAFQTVEAEHSRRDPRLSS